MEVKSKITEKEYDRDNVWYITNISQVGFYFSCGAGEEILDILYNPDKVKHNRVCFVYPKNEHMSVLFDLWMKHRQAEREKNIENAQ